MNDKPKNFPLINRWTFLIVWMFLALCMGQLPNILFAQSVEIFDLDLRFMESIAQNEIFLIGAGMVGLGVGFGQQVLLQRFWGIRIRHWTWLTAIGHVLGYVAGSLIVNDYEPFERLFFVSLVFQNIAHVFIVAAIQTWLLRSHLDRIWMYFIASIFAPFFVFVINMWAISLGLSLGLVLEGLITGLALLWLDYFTYEDVDEITRDSTPVELISRKKFLFGWIVFTASLFVITSSITNIIFVISDTIQPDVYSVLLTIIITSSIAFLGYCQQQMISMFCGIDIGYWWGTTAAGYLLYLVSSFILLSVAFNHQAIGQNLSYDLQILEINNMIKFVLLGIVQGFLLRTLFNNFWLYILVFVFVGFFSGKFLFYNSDFYFSFETVVSIVIGISSGLVFLWLDHITYEKEENNNQHDPTDNMIAT